MKILYAFVFFLGSVISSYSQQPSIKFDHLNINHGLSQNHIMCILQDKRGFMWFGTRDGLNKYDGYRFTIYRNDPKDAHSLSNNFVTGIAEDSKGMIWISTRGGGLNCYNREKDRFEQFRHDDNNSNSISSNLLNDVIIDHADNLWLCTEDAGVSYFDHGKKAFINYHHSKNDDHSLSSNNIRSVFEDSDQNIWIGTYDAGLNLFNRKTKTFIHYTHNDKDKSSISGQDIKAIFEDSKKRLWIGTMGEGLDVMDKATGTFKHFFSNQTDNKSLSGNVIQAIREDSDGNLWIGTENNGLNVFNPDKGIFYHYQYDQIDEKSLSHNSIYSIYKDRQGSMWIGTFAGGVSMAGKKLFTHYNHTSDNNSLSHNNVLCITESKNGKLWIGTDGGGVNLYDPKTKAFTHFMHVPGNKNSICGNYVLSIFEDSRGNVWIGTWADGITVYNPATKLYKHFKNDPANPTSLSSNNVWSILEDREKNLWIGTYGGGLNLFDYRTNSFKRYDDDTRNVTRQSFSLAEDAQGNLWIATDGGGIKVLNKKTGQFERLLHQDGTNSLSDDRVNFMHRDSRNNFWISTMSGLNYFDTKTNRFTVYTVDNGLPNNVIFGTLEDDNGKVWISTNRGLSCFDPDSKKFTNFTPADGLQSYEFKGRSLCKASSGAMYFGGINGFNEFFPDKITTDDFEPPLVFTGFQIFNKNIQIAKDDNDPSPLKKDISETNDITLPDENSVISFEFALLKYTDEDRKQYAYMLEGFDKDWNHVVNRRTATYTNLDPGHYIFKVKTLNRKGEWSNNIAAIALTITPPFWKTWWFRLAVVLGIALIAAAFYWFRINQVRLQKAKLQLLVEQQTAQLIQSAKEEQKARQAAEEASHATITANKALEQKNKELEQFAYVASHDLQEPLRTTTSFVQLLQQQYQGQLDDRADKYLTFITQSTDRMKILIKDLLDYSRIGRKKELSRIDCNELLQQLLADLNVAITENNAKISFDELPTINAYSTEIKQLFQNLITNALKFHKPDIDPVIHFSVSKKNGSWEFVCRDNGIGIEAEHKERIFVIFQRLHTRAQYEGSGIGLANCKKIVELHGGTIWVESVPGEGSAFYFTIPHLSLNKEALHQEVEAREFS
jgi:ligand-binding sensor domain-containing protein/signal transduction histidine kinase